MQRYKQGTGAIAKFILLLWETIDHPAIARAMAYQGAIATMIILIINVVITFFNLIVEAVTHASLVNQWTFMGIGVSVAIIFGMIAMSRVTAMMSVLLFVLQHFPDLLQGGFPLRWVLAAVLLVMLLNGVRGTFAYHRLKRQRFVQAESQYSVLSSVKW